MIASEDACKFVIILNGSYEFEHQVSAIPPFWVSGLPENLSSVFDYGIYNFSKTKEYKNIEEILKHVIYCFYRGKLSKNLKREMDRLVKVGKFTYDEDYNGFTGDGVFDPQEGIENLKNICENDQQFRELCVDFWQMSNALTYLGVTADIDRVIRRGKETQIEIDQRARSHQRDVTTMISGPMMFGYYKKDKSPYEIDLLRAFLAVKSILGTKTVVGTTKQYILKRMTGAKNSTLLQEILKSQASSEMYYKYSKRYHMDKLLEELFARGFITGKLAYKRRIYISTQYKTSELPNQVHRLLTINNSKVKRDINKGIERGARERLEAMMTTKQTTP